MPYASILYVNSIDKYLMNSFFWYLYNIPIFFLFFRMHQTKNKYYLTKKIIFSITSSCFFPDINEKFHLSLLYDNWTCAYLNMTPLIGWETNFFFFYLLKNYTCCNYTWRSFNFNHHIFNCYGNSQWGGFTTIELILLE